jgi:creatinine amidohydrolase
MSRHPRSNVRPRGRRRLKSHWWWDFTTRDFAALDTERIVAIIPVGAVEQHGPHLPVRVGAAINAGIIAHAVKLAPPNSPMLVLPALPIGKSNEHLAFPGTLSLSYETLVRLWYEVGESVHRAGVRRIIFFNSHGGQPQVMDIVARELRVKLGLFVVGCSWSRLIDKRDLFAGDELTHGIHGGEIETSVMLHLHRDLVEMKYAKNFVPLSVAMAKEHSILTPEGAVGFGWQTQDLHPAGALGNARAADARRGRKLVDRAAVRLNALVEEVSRFPLARITDQAAYNVR